MVMQARKHPRLGDGYFDRNQTHSYENSNKFSKPNDRTSDKVRRSPITSNNDGTGRNDVIENRSSPRYHRPCSQRLKDRDHHHEDSSKSPIVKNEAKSSSNKDVYKSQSSYERDGSSERQSNHDRTISEEILAKLDKKQLDWSEHLSSSGKKYYYNSKTEVSQWEKPRQLIDWERQQNLSRLNSDPNRTKERSNERNSGAGKIKKGHSQESVESFKENSELHASHTDSGSHNRNQTTTSHSSTTNSSSCSSNVETSATHLISPPNVGQVISEISGTTGLTQLKSLPPAEALRTIKEAIQLTERLPQSKDSHQCKTVVSASAQSQNQVNHHPVTVQTSAVSLNSSNTYHVNSTGAAHFSEGKNEIDRGRVSPGSDSSTHSTRHDSPTSSVSSLQSLNATGTSSLATAALKPSIPSLTPSLANYYREDLISHVVGWQADHAERQANRYWEEGHTIGSLNCTQVSAELKMARALVRLAEIQATLQEQRILFLRQQTKELEEWKSLNTFMADS